MTTMQQALVDAGLVAKSAEIASTNTAYQEGYYSDDGVNPYRLGTSAYEDFENGFLEGQSDKSDWGFE